MQMEAQTNYGIYELTNQIFNSELQDLNNSSGDTKTNLKQRRISRACDECRKRKTKCIGGTTPCQTCITRGLQCTFALPSYKRGPKPKHPIISDEPMASNSMKVDDFDRLIPSLTFTPDSSISPYRSFDTDMFPFNNDTKPDLVSSQVANSKELNVTALLPKLYKQGAISEVSEIQLHIIISYFQYLHNQIGVINPSHFVISLASPKLTPSFRFLLGCLYISTTKALPHLNYLYLQTYSTPQYQSDINNLANQLSNTVQSILFDLGEDINDLIMHREIGLNILRFKFQTPAALSSLYSP